MNCPSSDRDPVEVLAEEFVERHRSGERPSLTEYTQRHPEHADTIRKVFPALVKMEQLKPAALESPGSGAPAGDEGPRLERLGDFRILREVGRGGMGVVYEAEQVALGRHVALKVLPRHALLDPRRLRRFQREARAVARLHHTNIVPVHGVGEQEGLHYYVMQFIQGLGLEVVLEELKCLRRARDNRQPSSPDPGPSAAARGLLTGQFTASLPLSNGGPAADSPAEPPPGDHLPPRAPSGPSHAAVTPSLSDSTIHLPGQTESATLGETGRPYWRSVARIGIQVAEALDYASRQGVLHRDIKPSNLLLDGRGTVWVTDFAQ